jgi:hypothetical protein
MPSAAAPAIKNLVMCQAFPKFGCEESHLGIRINDRSGVAFQAGPDSAPAA